MTNEEYEETVERFRDEIIRPSTIISDLRAYYPSEELMEELMRYDWLRALYMWKICRGRYGLTIQTLAHLCNKDDLKVRKEMKGAIKRWWTEKAPAERKAFVSSEKFCFEQHWCSTTQLPVYEVMLRTLWQPFTYDQRLLDFYNKNKFKFFFEDKITKSMDYAYWQSTMLPPTLRTKELENWRVFEGDLERVPARCGVPENISRDERVRLWRNGVTPENWDWLKKAVAFK